jgi:hypothetical protein
VAIRADTRVVNAQGETMPGTAAVGVKVPAMAIRRAGPPVSTVPEISTVTTAVTFASDPLGID